MSLVSYPFVTLSKCAKVIPVIMVGALRGVYKPKNKQYFVAFFITIGLIVFNSSSVSNAIIFINLIYLDVFQEKWWIER